MSYLKHLYLRNFRNYAEAEIRFAPRLNLIWGDNAQGKTNLLEAIYLLSTGCSFRTGHLSELIREGQPLFYLEAEIVQNQIAQSIKLSFDGQNKRLQLNATTHASFNPLLGSLPLVLYAPGDSDLIDGAPALRRRFLNLHLAQSDPLYVHHLTRFWRAMKQRNCLLRSRNNDPIECWEAEMAHSAAYLHGKRQNLIGELKSPLSAHSGALSAGSELHELRYFPSCSENYPRQLEKNRFREQDLGFTLVGPHRDELSFWVGGKEARLFASEGQKKTAIASLRLAEWDRLFSHCTASPLMVIDDLGLPLDGTRQAHFHEKLAKLQQVFITTPFPSFDLPSQKIRVQGGNFSF